ncbi:hypothetical protein PGTUg99_007676, partial [Puccinia graminis f. sp. tritici]
MTPKEFMLHFVQSPNSDIAYLRRFWRQPKGVESTMDLVRSIHLELAKSRTGREAWDSFIQEELDNIAGVSYELQQSAEARFNHRTHR